MRRLNGKLLLGLILGVVILAGGVHVVHGLQAKRSADALIGQADLAEKKGDVAKTARYLERYLNYVPGDTATLCRYGLLILPEDPRTAPEDAERAAAALERVLSREPGRSDLRRKLVDLYMKQVDMTGGQAKSDHFSAAGSHLKILLAGQPKDSLLEFQNGRYLESISRFEEAAVMYDLSLRHDKTRIDAYVRRAEVLKTQLRRPREADGVMDAVTTKSGVVAANPGSARAYLERARYRREANLTGADADVARALELAPDDAASIAAAATNAINRGAEARNEARALLKRGIKLHPDAAELYLLLGRVEQAAGRPEEATRVYESAVKAMPGRAELRWYLASSRITEGTLDQASEAIKSLQDSSVYPETISFLEARLLARQGKWAAAADKLERATPQMLRKPGLEELYKQSYLLMGACYEMLGKNDRQFAAFRRAVDITTPNPSLDISARIGLASALASRERFDDAAAEYRKVLALPGAPPSVRVALARLYVTRDQRLPEAQQRWSDAEAALNDAEAAEPGSPEVAIMRAEVMLGRKRDKEAAELVKSALEKSPDRIELWAARIALERRQGRPEEALRLINEAEKRLGPKIEVLQARAAYWASKRGPDASPALDKLERTARKLDESGRRRLLPSLVDAYSRVGDMNRARRLTREWAADEPNNLSLRLALFDQAFQEDDLDTAESLLKDIQRLDPEQSLVLYGKAVILARRSEKLKDKGRTLEQARAYLAEAARLRPKWSRVPMAEAWIDRMQGNVESEMSNNQQAINLGERGAATIIRTTQLLYERGRFAEADQVMQMLRTETGLTGASNRMAAELALRTHDFERAISQARAAVTADPKDASNTLWLGRVLFMVGRQDAVEGRKTESTARIKEAEDALRRSISLAKDVADPRITLIQLLAWSGRTKEASAEAAAAERSLPGKGSALALAQCYEEAGDAAKAAGFYKTATSSEFPNAAALQAAARFALRTGKYTDAEAILGKLSTLKDAPRESAWARRSLALVLASGRDPRRAAEALDLVGGSSPSGPKGGQGLTSPDDRRARYQILAIQANRENRREAISILEGMIEDKSAVPADRYQLALLYNADGNWSKARPLLQALIAVEPNNLQYLSYYALSLLARGQTAEAAGFVGKIAEIIPDSAPAAELKIRLLHGQGRKAEADTLAEKFVREHDDQTRAFAILMENLGHFPNAETLYRRAASVPKASGARFDLIGFLARHGRTIEALDLCDSMWDEVDIGQMCALAVQVVTEAPSPDQAIFDRVAARLNSAIKKNPGRASLPFDLANLYSYEGLYEKAEVIYRQLCDSDKTKSEPLNNLAWLLALQDGKESEALPLIQRAIDLQGPSPSLLDTRAVVYIAMGRFLEAITDLENAVVASPAADRYFHLARAYKGANKRDNAIEALKKAKEMGLKAVELHPLERPTYDRLFTELITK